MKDKAAIQQALAELDQAWQKRVRREFSLYFKTGPKPLSASNVKGMQQVGAVLSVVMGFLAYRYWDLYPEQEIMSLIFFACFLVSLGVLYWAMSSLPAKLSQMQEAEQAYLAQRSALLRQLEE
jgi:hypothetical protein